MARVPKLKRQGGRREGGRKEGREEEGGTGGGRGEEGGEKEGREELPNRYFYKVSCQIVKSGLPKLLCFIRFREHSSSENIYF